MMFDYLHRRIALRKLANRARKASVIPDWEVIGVPVEGRVGLLDYVMPAIAA